jgi:uncharacterized membrane protein
VEQKLVIGEFVPQADLTLLSEDAENLIILDEDELAVDYQRDGKDLSIYALGANHVEVYYDLNTLTSKENEVWTLLLDNPYSITLAFPENSTIIYLSGTPTMIDTSGKEVTLSLGAGTWEISYLLQLVSGYQNNPTPTSSGAFSFPLEYLIVIVAVALVAILLLIFLARRKRQPNLKKALNENPQLMKDDKAVLEFLAEKGGQAFEAEIRQRFPDMPRTSLWRLVKRLEKLEIVEVKKIGLENQVKLRK